MNRSREFLVEQARKAAERGHTMTVNPTHGQLYRAMCSCGWMGPRKSSKVIQLHRAFWHLGEVAAEPTES